MTDSEETRVVAATPDQPVRAAERLVRRCRHDLRHLTVSHAPAPNRAWARPRPNPAGVARRSDLTTQSIDQRRGAIDADATR